MMASMLIAMAACALILIRFVLLCISFPYSAFAVLYFSCMCFPSFLAQNDESRLQCGSTRKTNMKRHFSFISVLPGNVLLNLSP